MSFLDEIDEEIRHAGLDQAVASGNTPPIFDWLPGLLRLEHTPSAFAPAMRNPQGGNRSYLAGRL